MRSQLSLLSTGSTRMNSTDSGSGFETSTNFCTTISRSGAVMRGRSSLETDQIYFLWPRCPCDIGNRSSVGIQGNLVPACLIEIHYSVKINKYHRWTKRTYQHLLYSKKARLEVHIVYTPPRWVDGKSPVGKDWSIFPADHH